MRISEKDYQKYCNGSMYGRIMEYDHQNGYGWIYTELGKDIWVSSYAFQRKKDENKITIGTTVKFELGKYNGRILAKQIEIVAQMPKNETLFVAKGFRFPVKYITKILHQSGEAFIRERGFAKQMKLSGYEYEMFDNVIIRTKRGKEYVFFGESCPIAGDGRIDLRKFWDNVNERYLYM